MNFVKKKIKCLELKKWNNFPMWNEYCPCLDGCRSVAQIITKHFDEKSNIRILIHFFPWNESAVSFLHIKNFLHFIPTNGNRYRNVVFFHWEDVSFEFCCGKLLNLFDTQVYILTLELWCAIVLMVEKQTV